MESSMVVNKKYRFFILTGPPGVGKTTLVKKICSLVSTKGLKPMGFYTEEVRKNNLREGFDIVTLDGVRGRLARDYSLLDKHVPYNVGKYGVLMQEFQDIVVTSLIPCNKEPTLVVIDEIGKMELFSEIFQHKVSNMFSDHTEDIILATVPLRSTDSLIVNIKNNAFSKVWTVTKQNRNTIHTEIIKEISKTFNLV